MSLISWILLGLISGSMAKAVVGGGSDGWIMTIVLGILGALVGGWLGSTLFGASLRHFFSLQTWILAVLGGFLVTFIYNKMTNKS